MRILGELIEESSWEDFIEKTGIEEFLRNWLFVKLIKVYSPRGGYTNYRSQQANKTIITIAF